MFPLPARLAPDWGAIRLVKIGVRRRDGVKAPPGALTPRRGRCVKRAWVNWRQGRPRVIRDAAAGESGCTRMLSALGWLAGAVGQWRGQMPLCARRCSPGMGSSSPLGHRTDGLWILRKARCPSDLAVVTAFRAGRDDPLVHCHVQGCRSMWPQGQLDSDSRRTARQCPRVRGGADGHLLGNLPAR